MVNRDAAIQPRSKNVTVIPQRTALSYSPLRTANKRRVAAYARVSTDSDEQFTSYEAQIDYYTRYIQQREDWEFVKVYADEGLSGVSTLHRPQFNTMIKDALEGKIDLIITKSVSRFARNTVDSLVYVRKLKENGTEIFFEKENIWTLDSKGELLITIMSSIAQEESRSISENVTWGQRKRFADGKMIMSYNRFLGYEKGEGDAPVINEKQAAAVRWIYRLFLEGKTTTGIGKILTEAGIPTPAGKKEWQASTILSILTNEKYKGDALLQKTYTVDFLTKKKKSNEGEIPQYYVKNSHPAIVRPIEFDLVQEEIERRKLLGRSYSGSDPFTSRLFCADCGCLYGKKTWHSNDPYKHKVHRCNNKFRAKTRCETPTLDEQVIIDRFLKAYNLLMGNRESVIEDCKLMRSMLGDCTEFDAQIASMKEELEVVVGLIQGLIKENAQNQIDQNVYTERYNGLVVRAEKIENRMQVLMNEKEKRQRRDREIEIFVELLDSRPLLLESWDVFTWNVLLNKAIIHRNGDIEFVFRNKTTITISTKAEAT